ncbi:beta-1,6-N-acetylglucosaminyltransferase [uncultured Methanobrevibacter sp.]|uniref:beta-1,6-N-acetylglucosaminyltransferase n=1 Tax=uncultured Methanobrevibacter sp. TaxID=253161 RepID=UPI0025D24A3A|nr:beta-1,6-N-acetylglucosaminyltransferase [uncultured Methanobrevibacter sp.]
MNKQAILIIAHNYSNLEILNKQLDVLDSECFDIFIHIDRKSKMRIEDIKKCENSKMHIYKKFRTYWGHSSQVYCELFLIRKALETEEKYDYLHLISGEDFPLKKPEKIHAYFNKHYGKEFVHFQCLKLTEKKVYWNKYYRFIRNHNDASWSRRIDIKLLHLQMRLKIDRTKRRDIKLYTGANWFSITDKFAEFAISKSELMKKLRFTAHPDEIYMQTILYNSEFKNNLYYQGFDDNYDSCKRLIDWKRGKPYIWKMEDLKEIEESNFFFARKFDINTDRKIIDYLNKKLK